MVPRDSGGGSLAGHDAAAETGHLLPVLQVLLVEDDPADALLAQEYLDGSIPGVDWVRSVGEACNFLQRFHVDCVLLDLNLPDTFGFDGLERVQAAAPDVAVIVLTGDGDSQRGIGAVSRGAQDFLVKNQVDGPLLTRAIRYAAERKRTESSLRGAAGRRDPAGGEHPPAARPVAGPAAG